MVVGPCCCVSVILLWKVWKAAGALVGEVGHCTEGGGLGLSVSRSSRELLVGKGELPFLFLFVLCCTCCCGCCWPATGTCCACLLSVAPAKEASCCNNNSENFPGSFIWLIFALRGS